MANSRLADGSSGARLYFLTGAPPKPVLSGILFLRTLIVSEKTVARRTARMYPVSLLG
jgi:hypothetical protein